VVPFSVCLMLVLWVGSNLVERQTWAWWIALGLTWGVAVLLRGSVLWCVVPVAVWISYAGVKGTGQGGGWARGVRVAGPVVAIGLTFAVLAPWLGRNYGLFHSGPLRLTTLEGISLYEAVYPEADGGPRQDKITLPPEIKGLSEAQRNDEWSRRAWGYIGGEPLRMVRLGMVKFGRTWSPWFNAAEMRSPALWWGMTLWYVPLFVLAMVGIAAGEFGRGNKVLWLIPIVYFSVLHSLFLGSVRYRVPVMPLVCVFAGAGVTACLRRAKRGGIRKRSAEVPV
jgi:hypothetical protein